MPRIVNRSIGFVSGLVLLGAGLGGCSGSRVPDWSFTSASGAKQSLSDYHGQVVVLGFTNTWCDPCQEAAPHLQELQERFADRGVKVLAVNAWERGDPESYMQEHGYTFGLLLNGTELAREYQVTQIPTFYVIGANGRAVYRHEGFEEDTPKQMARVIEKQLRKLERNALRHQKVAQHNDAEMH